VSGTKLPGWGFCSKEDLSLLCCWIASQCAALTKLLDTRSTDRTGTRSTRVTSTKKTSRCSPGGKGFEVFLPLYTAPGIKHLGFPQMLGVGALVDSVLRLLSAPKPDGAQFTRWNRVSD
jgi:hypothetical protein